jgi:hypothetical protein
VKEMGAFFRTRRAKAGVRVDRPPAAVAAAKVSFFFVVDVDKGVLFKDEDGVVEVGTFWTGWSDGEGASRAVGVVFHVG